jgi:hypothetical protein
MILNWSSELSYIGLQPLIRSWTSGGGAAVIPSSARGNIDFDQIRVAARTGNGQQLLTWSIPAPATHSSTGTPGQIAYDASGNLYFCYAANSWARLGSSGYSNTF